VRALVLSLVFVLPACAESETVPTAPVSDTSESESESEPEDSGEAIDSVVDTADPTIADTTTTDTTTPDTTLADTSVADTAKADTALADTRPADMGTDTAFMSTDHVHIYITNTCKVSVSPTSFTVPAGETLKLSYHNHSIDYRADVWMMYGGGYLGLEKGATWNETYAHCFGPSASTGYADINIEGGPVGGCPGVRLNIYCR
jgi:hypothetical protein